MRRSIPVAAGQVVPLFLAEVSCSECIEGNDAIGTQFIGWEGGKGFRGEWRFEGGLRSRDLKRF